MKIGKRLNALRIAQKMTLKELSEKSGIQIATLSRMENDIMTGTLDSHITICEALGVSLSDFYGEIEHEQKKVSLSTKKEKHESFVHAKKSTAEMLTSKILEKKMTPLLIKIQKGGKTHEEVNKVGSEKFIYLLKGKIHAKIGKEEYILSRGDSVYFDASLSHLFSNMGKSEARFISILSPPSI